MTPRLFTVPPTDPVTFTGRSVSQPLALPDTDQLPEKLPPPELNSDWGSGEMVMLRFPEPVQPEMLPPPQSTDPAPRMKPVRAPAAAKIRTRALYDVCAEAGSIARK